MTEPKPPKPLFLAPQARQGDGSGYLNQPIRRELPEGLDRFELADHANRVREATRAEDEPECIGPAILNSYAESNQFRYSQQHAADVLAARQMRPLLRAEDRLRDAERRAKYAKRRDLKGEFLALKGMLARYTRNDDEPKPGSSVLRRLEGVEAKLDGLEEAA
jgi:hypothetical protein